MLYLSDKYHNQIKTFDYQNKTEELLMNLRFQSSRLEELAMYKNQDWLNNNNIKTQIMLIDSLIDKIIYIMRNYNKTYIRISDDNIRSCLFGNDVVYKFQQNLDAIFDKLSASKKLPLLSELFLPSISWSKYYVDSSPVPKEFNSVMEIFNDHFLSNKVWNEIKLVSIYDIEKSAKDAIYCGHKDIASLKASIMNDTTSDSVITKQQLTNYVNRLLDKYTILPTCTSSIMLHNNRIIENIIKTVSDLQRIANNDAFLYGKDLYSLYMIISRYLLCADYVMILSLNLVTSIIDDGFEEYMYKVSILTRLMKGV